MALPDYLAASHGTAIVFGQPSASGVTANLTFDALASGSARMSASADLGATWDQDFYVYADIESGTAPTAGGSVDVYLASSHNNTRWPGGVTGSDAAWPSDGNEDEWAKQLGLPVTQVIATNDGNVVQAQQGVIWRPPARYVVAVADVNWDQAVRDEATATNNDSRIYLVPVRSSIVDT